MNISDLRKIGALGGSTVEGYDNSGDATPDASLRDNVLRVLGEVDDARLNGLAAGAAALQQSDLRTRAAHVLVFFLVDADARASVFVLPEAVIDDEAKALLDTACVFADPGDVQDDEARWCRLMKLVAAMDAETEDDCEVLFEQTSDAFGEDALPLEEIQEWAGRWEQYRVGTATDLDYRFVRVVVATQSM